MQSAYFPIKTVFTILPRAGFIAALLMTPSVLWSKTITVIQGTQFAADLSPNGQQIVFDLQGTLWLLPAEGGAALALTDPRDDSRLPKWSPNGKHVAFQAYREDQWQIWVIELGNSLFQQVTRGAYDSREPEWSADGRSLFFSSDRSGNYDIWKVDFDSSPDVNNPVAITHTSADEFYPAVSSSNQLAYLFKEPGWGKPAQIRIVQNGEPETIFSADKLLLSGLSWLPDGQSLSYVGYDDVWNSSSTALYQVNPESGGILQLSETGQDVFPYAASWINAHELLHAQDGEIQLIHLKDKTRKAISFTANFEIHQPKLKPRQKDLADSSKRPVKGIYSPAISSDGRQLAFSALGDLWLQSINPSVMAKTPERFTLPASLEIHPSFSPDSKRLAYASDRSGNMDIWVVDLLSGSHVRLTEAPGVESKPQWSANGKSIVFLSSARDQITQKVSIQQLDTTTGQINTVISGLLSPGAPSLSPDGNSITFAALEPASGRFREGRNQIRALNLQSGQSHAIGEWNELNLDSRESSGPVWSAKTNELVFVHSGNLWAARMDATNHVRDKPRKLNQELSAHPSLDASGTHIVYQSGSKIRRLDLAGAAAETLTVNLDWAPANSPPPLLIQAGRVFDTESQSYRIDMDILVQNRRIEAISERGTIAFNGKIIDARDSVVLPGLIDSHTHQSAIFGQSLGRLWLSFGVTSVREPGADPYDALQRKETWASDAEPGPRLFFTGPLLDGQSVYYSLARPFDDDVMLQQELDRALDLEYDLLKSYVRMPDRMQETVIHFAAKHGLAFSSHDIYPAVAYGANAVEHLGGTSRSGFSDKQSLLNVAYQDVIALLSETGMSLTPTLSLQVGLAALVRENAGLIDDSRYQKFFDEAEKKAFKTGFLDAYFGHWDDLTIAAALQRQRKVLQDLALAGVKITFGTDSPFVPYGFSLLTELIASVGVPGMSTEQAILSATHWAAEALGAGDQLGQVTEGYLADMIIVRGDPLLSIDDILKVSDVISDGQHFTVSELMNNPASYP